MAREMMVRGERHRLNSRNRRFVQLYLVNSERHSDLPSSLDATKRYPFSLSRPVTSLRQYAQCVAVTPNNILSLLHFLFEPRIAGGKLVSAFRPLNQEKPVPPHPLLAGLQPPSATPRQANCRFSGP